MRVIVDKDYQTLSRRAALFLAGEIIRKPDTVLGLATGSTPVGTYQQLVKLHQERMADFSEVTTFNLDEYYGVSPDNQCSYAWFMDHHLFGHVNVQRNNIHIPNGLTQDVELECRNYEDKIQQAGGIEVQLLGIGRNGHIGFNEPSSEFAAHTSLVELDQGTIEANSRFFDSRDQVPRQAISMGIKSIMKARRILLLANGSEKAEAIYNTLCGPITPQCPASVLQLHPDVTIMVDKEAGKDLPREC